VAGPSNDPTTTVTVTSTTAAVVTTAGVTTTAAVASTATTQAEAAIGEPFFGGLDRQIGLLTPEAGGGGRPLLEWEPVPGADHYAVYVYAPDDRVYWAWTGDDARVHVGGEPQLLEGVSGPSISPGMSWAVIAFDADLLPIAVSERREIAP
jgi:hypothetical protein